MEICQENSPEYAALFAYYEKLAAVLEEMRLPYFEKNADKRENRWSQIISGSDLIDTI